MDGIPSFDEAVRGGNLTQDVARLAPLATTYHGVQPGVAAQFHAATNYQSQGVLPAFWGKIESVISEGAHLAGAAGSFVGHQVANMATSIPKTAVDTVHFAENAFKANSNSHQTQELTQRLQTLSDQYKSGAISSAEYQKSISQWIKDNTKLTNDISANMERMTRTDQSLAKNAINAAGTVATIVSLGGLAPEVASGEAAAAKLLSSASELAKGADVIAKLATDEAAWKAVNPLAQNAIKLSTSQMLQVAGKQATAQEVSKAVAVNVLLKYPLVYNVLSETGHQIYDELNNNKYGDAVKTIAFNAALLLSGGPIGWGLKNAGKALKATSVAAGLRPGSVLDELSSLIGNGDSRGLAKIAQKEIAAGNGDSVKAMIVGLESNMKAAGGNSAKAVNQIVDHLENYVGWGSMKNLTHEQAWNNIVNYWKHAEGLQELKKAGQIAGIARDDARTIVPGRFTIQDKNAIALTASKDGEAGWQAFKAANPNLAAANNPNLDRQITHLIQTIKDPKELHDAINNIPAQFGLEGIPKDYAAKMAKDGYIAIIPESHNLPVTSFAETSGKLATKGAKGDFFVSAGQPVPVLRSIGSFLTYAGLSPEVAQQRVNDVFKQNFADGLKGLEFQHLGGKSEDVLSTLYNYAKSPTVGRINVNGRPLRVPITDLRQLTTRDVMTALSTTRSNAKDIQEAIMQAYIDVPRSISGLGTKIMDRNFKLNPAAAPYSRLQGAFRFGWNPVFRQGRLPLKAEFLAQMQTGGKFPTVAGTNTFMKMFFPGKYKELDGISKTLEEKGLLPGGLGAEAADSTGATIAHTGHYPKNAILPVAGLVSDMAAKVGMDSKSFIEQFPKEVEDATTAILHYDRNASFLNSPLARTLNFAFFPFRFNVKVSTFMAKALVKQEPVVQYAVVKGMMNASDYLKSPQGQAWYSQNADVITLFKYFSPVETLSTIANALGAKHDSTAQYGELGGLPFGWIPQMLDSVGLTHFGQAYVNPKTGVIAKDHVPTSAYGALNAAINDLLGSLYTYPGAEVGLPGKGTIDRKIVGGFLPGSDKDFNAVNPTNVTPQDQSFSQVVQQLHGTPAASPPPVTVPQPEPVKVPASATPLTVPKVKPKSAGGGPKKKKADYRPQLLPGQSTLGQL